MMRLSLVLLCVGLRAVAQEADWSHFNVTGEADRQLCSDIVSSVQISNYWDVVKGKFRTGIIGEHVADKVPFLMLTLEKKVSLGSGYRTFTNVQAVDFYALFHIAVVAVQHLATAISELPMIKAHMPEEEFPDVSEAMALMLKFDSAMSPRCSQCHLASYVANERALLQKKGELIDVKAEAIKRNALRNLENEKKELEEKKKLHFASHNKLSTSLDSHHAVLKSIALDKATKQYELSTALDDANYASQEASAEVAARVEAAINEAEVGGAIEAVRYKYAQLGRLGVEGEGDAARVLHAQAEAEKQASEEAIRAVVDEVSSRLSWMYTDPLLALQKGKWLLWGVLLLVALYDLALLLPLLFLRSLDKHFIVRNPLSSGRRAAQGQELLGLCDAVLAKEHRDPLVAYVLSVRRSGDGPLPNLLIAGAHGCGKTLLAHKVCEDLALPFVIISESDLGAQGWGALHLRQLLINRRSRLVVVLDGADFIVRSRRDLKRPGCGRDATMSHCFYVLLDAIKNNCSYLSVILTTSCPLGKIDRALLDRMDTTVTLQVPATALRLKFAIKEMKRAVLDFLPAAAREELCDPSVDEFLNDLVCAERPCKIVETALSLTLTLRRASPETELPSVAVSGSSSSKTFNVAECVCALVAASEGWSFRELHKFFSSLRTQALSTDGLVLDSGLWSKQLMSSVKSAKLE